MKTSILASFVAIALFSTTLANVIPSSAISNDPNVFPYPSGSSVSTLPNRRATIESLEAQANNAATPIPVNAILANAPVARSLEIERRDLFNDVFGLSPTSNRRASVESLETQVDEAASPVPADAVLANAPIARSSGIKARGFFTNMFNAIPSLTSTSADSLKKRQENGANPKYDDSRDIQYLNLALFMQQLESTFFERGLSKYSQADFVKAGFPDWVRGRYMQIMEHEKTRLDFLQSAVTSSGRDHVMPCDYEFSDNDVHAFVDLSEAITTIVAGGYVGGLHYFSNTEYVSVGASILSVESRQASWINSAVRKQHPWNTAFETPLSPNQVLTLLTSFFDFNKMPAQNNGLLPPGLHPYPRLWLAPRLVPGEEAEISFQNPNVQKDERLFAAFLFGFETIFAPVTERQDSKQGAGAGHDNRSRYFVQIPKDLEVKGTVFVVVLKGKGSIGEVRMDDQSTVAGPAIAMFPFGANHEALAW